MKPARWTRVRGDVNDTITAQIGGVDDLNAVTNVTARVWRKGVTPIALTGTVLDAAERTITVNLSTWLSSTSLVTGQWWIDFKLHFGADQRTWPSGAPAQIVVRSETDT